MHTTLKRGTAPHSATDKENQLTLAQLKALGPLASGQAISHVAASAGVDRTTVYRWLRDDAAFVAEFNRRKGENVDAIQAELRTMARRAVDVLRQLLDSKDTPASVRFRVALAVLGTVGGIQAPDVGETDPSDIEHAWRMKRERQFRLLKQSLDS